MSTKSTIGHGQDFHIYQELFEVNKVYLQIDYRDDLTLEGGKLTLKLTPELLERIALAWVENSHKFDREDFDPKGNLPPYL